MYFTDCQQVELSGLEILIPYFNAFSTRPPEPITGRDQQKTIGDLICYFEKLGTKNVEVKIEQRYTGNLFLETWSNREWSTLGWLFTCRADMLVYYVIDRDLLIVCDLDSLRHWCLNKQSPNIDRYKELPVKQDQRNDARGVPVPIEHLRSAKLKHWYEGRPLEYLKRQNVATRISTENTLCSQSQR